MSMKVYTKTGDRGETSLVGGTRVAKSDRRLNAYGTVDELNAALGLVRSHLDQNSDELDSFLKNIQSQLFAIGSQLACEKESVRQKLPQLAEDAAEQLEHAIDAMSEQLSELKNFILPGGTVAAAHAHMARTICRRAERAIITDAEEFDAKQMIVRYVNRLSDYLFVLARYLNHSANVQDTLWTT